MRALGRWLVAGTVSAVACLALNDLQSSAAITGPLALLPDTTDRIVPFADQLLPNYSDRLVEFVATHFAGAQKMLRQDNERFRARNPRWLLLHYRLAVSSGPAPYIHRNTWSSDWSEVNTHENWFLHNDTGRRHHQSDSNWDLHDVENADFRDYWARTAIADMRTTGAQGVFADSFEAGVSGYGITPPDARFAGTAPASPAAWRDGRTWMMLKTGFMTDMMRRFKATPEQFLFVPNLAGLATGWWWPDYSAIDGAMLEGFAVGNTPDDWLMAMNRAIRLTRAGKFIIVQAYPKTVDERLFLIGSYLLLKGSHTFINAAGAGVFYFPEYDLPLGPPKDPLPTDVRAYAWSRVYKREFRDAVVLVNPRDEVVSVPPPPGTRLAVPTGGGETGDAQIDRSGRYIGGSITYRAVASIAMPAHSAVLLARK